MSQTRDILEHMATSGSITTYEAFTEYGCTRLSARIADIKELGYEVESKLITRKNRCGKPVTFSQYWLSNKSLSEFEGNEVKNGK